MKYLLLGAEGLGDGVEGGVHAGDVDESVLVGDTVLDVEALDINESAGGGAIVSDELGDDGERLGSIKDTSGTVEVGVAHSVRVEIASVGVAEAGVSVRVTAIVTSASGLPDDGAGMRSIGGRDGVGLPDILLDNEGQIKAVYRVRDIAESHHLVTA